MILPSHDNRWQIEKFFPLNHIFFPFYYFSLEFGIWNLEFGTWNLVLGIWYLVFGTWYLLLWNLLPIFFQMNKRKHSIINHILIIGTNTFRNQGFPFIVFYLFYPQ